METSYMHGNKQLLSSSSQYVEDATENTVTATVAASDQLQHW